MTLIDTFERAPTLEALKLLDDAIARDPDYAQAMALAAYGHGQVVVSRWADDVEPSRNVALAFAKRAAQLAADDADVLSWVAGAYLTLQVELDPALALIDRSLTLNPGSAQSWMMSGWIRLALGDCERAIEHLETSMRLDPRSPDRGYHIGGVAFAKFAMREFEAAAQLLREAIPLQPAVTMNLALLAACYGHLGDHEAARTAIARYRAASPIALRERLAIYRTPAHRQLFLEGVERAEEAAA